MQGMEDPKLRGTVRYEAVESVPDFRARDETMNGIGLSAAKPANPHTFTCVFRC